MRNIFGLLIKFLDKIKRKSYNVNTAYAVMAELADAYVWGAYVYDIRVQVPVTAPKTSITRCLFLYVDLNCLQRSCKHKVNLVRMRHPLHAIGQKSAIAEMQVPVTAPKTSITRCLFFVRGLELLAEELQAQGKPCPDATSAARDWTKVSNRWNASPGDRTKDIDNSMSFFCTWTWTACLKFLLKKYKLI